MGLQWPRWGAMGSDLAFATSTGMPRAIANRQGSGAYPWWCWADGCRASTSAGLTRRV